VTSEAKEAPELFEGRFATGLRCVEVTEGCTEIEDFVATPFSDSCEDA
jgi:hypothetical protein